VYGSCASRGLDVDARMTLAGERRDSRCFEPRFRFLNPYSLCSFGQHAETPKPPFEVNLGDYMATSARCEQWSSARGKKTIPKLCRPNPDNCGRHRPRWRRQISASKGRSAKVRRPPSWSPGWLPPWRRPGSSSHQSKARSRAGCSRSSAAVRTIFLGFKRRPLGGEDLYNVVR
jgi:hypothetical protein